MAVVISVAAFLLGILLGFCLGYLKASIKARRVERDRQYERLKKDRQTIQQAKLEAAQGELLRRANKRQRRKRRKRKQRERGRGSVPNWRKAA